MLLPQGNTLEDKRYKLEEYRRGQHPNSRKSLEEHGFQTRSKEEMKAIGHLGGSASVNQRWANKTFQQLAIAVLTASPTKKLSNIFKEGYPEWEKFVNEGVNIKLMLFLAQVSKALKGDAQAFENVERLLGEGSLNVGDKLDKLLEAMSSKVDEVEKENKEKTETENNIESKNMSLENASEDNKINE